MDEAERAKLAEEFESVRAPGLSIAEAAARFRVRTADLDHALWLSEPDMDRGSGVHLNTDYIDRQLDEHARDWRQARDDLRHELEQHFERLTGRQG